MIYRIYYKLFQKVLFSYHYRFRRNKNLFKESLLKHNQSRWLDLGSSTGFKEGFYFADILEVDSMPKEIQSKYFRLDVTKPFKIEDIDRLGKFDFIRMQHVFEHFTMEDAQIVLENCHKILNSQGYLLITVPDLEIFVKLYSQNAILCNKPFAEWAETRIGKSAPQSFYFSIFSHSVLYQQHLWCYDEKGLRYQLNKSGKFSNVKRIKLFDKLCNIPFTHNRPLEDLCILSQKV